MGRVGSGQGGFSGPVVLLTPLVPESRFGDKAVKFPSSLSPKRDCGSKRVETQVPRSSSMRDVEEVRTCSCTVYGPENDRDFTDRPSTVNTIYSVRCERVAVGVVAAMKRKDIERHVKQRKTCGVNCRRVGRVECSTLQTYQYQVSVWCQSWHVEARRLRLSRSETAVSRYLGSHFVTLKSAH